MADLKGKKYRKPLADMSKLLDGHVIGRMVDEEHYYGVKADRLAEIEAQVVLQAETLRRIAFVIEETGVPIDQLAVSPNFRGTWEMREGPDAKRDYARLQARFVNAVGAQHFPEAKREKISTDHVWGMGIDLGCGLSYSIAVSNEDTCEFVPVTDDNGEPVMDVTTVEAREEQVTEEPRMEKRCITLFAPSK